MLIDQFSPSRKHRLISLKFDLVIVGGGITGVCTAIAAARKGVKVALIQDRSVLGGNGSSEIRVWMLGATSHMGNNNRWARESGIIGEILEENLYRNKEGNPHLFDILLIDKVLAEENISLFLNTVVFDIVKKDNRNVSAVKAFNTQNATEYLFEADFFSDASGDGILAYLAGATYRIGAEDREEFDERFAPDKQDYGENLGHTLFFYTKNTPVPVKFVVPKFALTKENVERNINRIQNPNYFDYKTAGCKFWWIEYGGRLDTIYDTEKIKYELWKIAYGIWDYIKNSGKYPDTENMTLEWVGSIPGKRETRRFIGPYVLSQRDVVEQRTHYDAVTYGGWSIDLHPADGVYSTKAACNQWHSKGVFQIPYRCFITNDLDNVFISGRLISVSHVAYGATRVMLTSALGGEVVGTAISLCLKNNILPKDLSDPQKINILQKELIESGNYISQFNLSDYKNLLSEAEIKVSSELELSEIPFKNGFWKQLSNSAAQMLPVRNQKFPVLKIKVKASSDTTLKVDLRISSKPFNHTPDVSLSILNIDVKKGEHEVELNFKTEIPHNCYAFVCFMQNENIELLFSEYRFSGILSVFNKIMPDVSNWGKQQVNEDIGIEEFEFWCPERRPEGHNIAMKINPAISAFSKQNLLTPIYRPVEKPNAWVASLEDKNAEVIAEWDDEKSITEMDIFADADFDHPMETIQWTHPEHKMPFCIESVSIFDNKNKLVAEINRNHQSHIKIRLTDPVYTDKLIFKVNNPHNNVPASLFGISVR